MMDVKAILIAATLIALAGVVAYAIAGRMNRPSFELDYDQAIQLDAENLAERGIADAYHGLLPKLRQFVPHPAEVAEQFDEDTGRYLVKCGSAEYLIFGDDSSGEDEANGWGRATYVLFRIVNDQLEASSVRFYAINGGNDLFGIFLAPDDAFAARASLPKATDWPYLPENVPPWFGMPH